jgi:hypothetical protein
MALWRGSQPTTVRDFCAEHGLAEQSFYWWRLTLGQRDRASSTSKPAQRKGRGQQSARFVQVRIVPAPIGTAADLQIVLSSGHVVRVPTGFDPATLRQLLAILKEEPPC